jgi:hypothetical protein
LKRASDRQLAGGNAKLRGNAALSQRPVENPGADHPGPPRRRNAHTTQDDYSSVVTRVTSWFKSTGAGKGSLGSQ